ncbi:ACT domain-containing protein [Oceanobacillus halotolerans]|uniref:ACT domain-containing protein n=1 Tax=Oceanobacillus halotolerans TaxID=2663380 RepID=UPI0013DCABBA|nr:ACT domain-containing protein [Oceanobacillus halotolerans]
MEHEEKFYLVRSDVLPESIRKTMEVKELLERGTAHTIQEAVRKVDLSRSAYYKYKDAVFPFQAMVKEKIITLFFLLEDRAGTLSNLLKIASDKGCNVLTIHQTIPIQGRANVTLSLDASQINGTIDQLIHALKQLDFVKRVDILSSGAQ